MPPNTEDLKHFDRVVLLDGGKVVSHGTPDEVVGSREFQSLQAPPAQVCPALRASVPSPAEGALRGSQEVAPRCPGSPLWRAMCAGGLGRLCAAVVTVGLL